MRNNREKSFEYAASAAPPRGLFSRIIKRLGLEKELVLIKKHLRFFTALLATFSVLTVFAFIGIKHVLAGSSFGPLLSLIFSDPGMVVKYWRIFLFSVFESMPGLAIAGLLFSLAFLTLFVRFIVFTAEKFSIITKSINKQKQRP